ncbi:MAG: hypothetical protein WC647_18450, partial [Desulfomonilaceae bacterium]
HRTIDLVMPKKSPPEGRNIISIHTSDCLRKRGLCPFSAEPVQIVKGGHHILCDIMDLRIE